jgi:hypothetical protein
MESPAELSLLPLDESSVRLSQVTGDTVDGDV